MIVHDLKKHVLCSQCRKFRFASGPYQCKQGHMICPECQPFTDVCPQCFIYVDVKDPIRCHSAVDFLMDKVPVPCVYKIFGCRETNDRGLIRQHVSICPFRKDISVTELIKAIETAKAVPTVGGAGSVASEDDAADLNDHENIDGRAGGRVNEDNAGQEPAINDQNEATVGGAGEHVSGNTAEPALIDEDMNDQNEDGFGDVRKEHNYAGMVLSDEESHSEETVNGASLGIQNQQIYELIVLSDDSDYNEDTDGGAGTCGDKKIGEKAVAADATNRNDETVAGGSVDIRSEEDYEVIVLSDGSDYDEENVGGGVVDLADEDETATQEAVKRYQGNMEIVRGAKDPAVLNPDDNMDAEDEQIEETSGVKGDNDRVVLSAEDGVDIGMEVEEVNRDSRVEEGIHGGKGSEDDGIRMEGEDLGSVSPVGRRTSKRKRMQPDWYSSQAFAAKAKSEKKKKPWSSLFTRLRSHNNKRWMKVINELKNMDSTAPQHQSSSELKAKETPECKLCQKTFCSKSSLARHNEKVHQVQRQFACTICLQKFRQMPHVTYHLASFHSSRVTEQINDDPVVVVVHRCCMFCDSRFVQKEQLRNHILEMHKDKLETSDGTVN